MPELAELAIMSDFVNRVSEKAIYFRMNKSEVSKVKTPLTIPFECFTLKARSRGKEMALDFYDEEGNKKHHQSLIMTMGMSGNWTSVHGNFPVPNHAHFFLHGNSPRGKLALCMVDVRRFAKWKWKDDFSSDRSPCPVKEHAKFRENFREKISLKNRDEKPMVDVIMDQSIFNGIGNYLRAEIFHRADINPFKSFKDLESNEVEKILDFCRICPQDAYELGGGQIKDWKNSFGVDGKTFDEWRKIYYKGNKILDKGGRTFWHDPKWEDSEQLSAYIFFLEKHKPLKL
jgi:endonuclease VIII-like 1